MYLRVVCPLVWRVVLLGAATLLSASATLQGASVTLAWDASASPNITGYSLHYGTVSRAYTGHLNLGNVLTGTISNLTAGTRYYFAVTAKNNLGLESDWSSEISYTPSSTSPTNARPTLNIPNSVVLAVNAGQQTVNLTGISSGSPSETQTLTVTASHNNPSLLGPVTVTYTSPSSNGTLRFTPVTGATGTATMNATVNDGGSLNNTITRTFTVTVNGSAGGTTIFVEAETGTLVSPMAASNDSTAWGGRRVSSSTSEQGTASYTLNIPTAGNYRILCRLIATTSGTDSFYVKMDSGAEDVFHAVTDGAYSTTWQWEPVRGVNTGDPRIFNLTAGTHTLVFRCREASTRLDAFYVTSDASFVPPASPPPGGNQPPTLNAIGSVTINEDSPQQTINLTGIGSGSASEFQTLTVTATSSNPSLIPNPTITYTSPGTNGTLRFTPMANGSGTSTITVTVNDGQTTNNTVQRSFAVTVVGINDAPIANAGPDATVTLPALLNLSGTATDDGLPNPPARLFYSWSKVSGPGTVLFSASTSLLGTVSFSLAGQYVLRLTVTDGESAASDDRVITVNGLIDLTGPVVSGQTLETLDVRSFTMVWQTDEPARCQMEFGTTTGLGSSSPLETSNATTHRATFTNLTAGSMYYFRIRSTDPAGNLSLTGTAPISTPPLNIFAFTAEDGTLTSPMSILNNDDTAMGGRYVVSPTANSGSARFPINVSSLSTYKVWCRVWGPAAGVGSFAVSADGGAEDTFDAAETGWRNGWIWVAVNGRGGGAPLTVNPRRFTLNSGIHQLTFRALEANTRLDEIILSNDPQWSPNIQGSAPVLTATLIATDEVRLNWTDTLADENGFQLEVSEGAGFTDLATLPANTTTYTHGGLPGGATRYYRIYGFNDADRTDYSNVATNSTGQAPATPSELTASQTGKGAVDLNWRDNSTDETGFVLERSRNGTTFTALQTLGANVTTASDPDPPRGNLYYRICAYNSFGNSSHSSVVVLRAK